jgi:hypothetical protein
VAGQFWVYVIELDATGLGDVGEGAVYVGETAKTPEERFVNHKAGGIKAAKVVARRGKNPTAFNAVASGSLSARRPVRGSS